MFFLDSPITAITMEHKRDYEDYQLSWHLIRVSLRSFIELSHAEQPSKVKEEGYA
jgi:hypothetical protein